MSRLDPTESFEALKEKVKESISSKFPYEGKSNILRLKNIDIEDSIDMRDVNAQKDAKMSGRTWGVPVYAELELVNKETGKVINTTKTKVATLPKITNRYSYIVDGSEYQVDNLWLLKPGVYTRVKQNGELESQFNFKGGGFHVNFDPESKAFSVRHRTANPPLYPIMKAMGVSDDDLERTWGKDILNANRKPDYQKAAINFANRLDPYKQVNNYDDAAKLIQSTFAKAELRPEVTQRTLGKPLSTITPETMVLSSKRLLEVARGETPDDRDALMFKDLKSTEDFVADRINAQSKVIARKIGNNIDRKENVRDVIGPDLFNSPIRSFFTRSSLASTSEMTNPLTMLTSHQKTTIMGDEGGIKSSHKIIEDAKLVNPSHLGFLDPLHTPEGAKTGVTLHLTLGASKRGGEITLPLYNVKTGKMERVNPAKAFDSTVVMPDEVEWKNGKPVAKGKTVKASLKGNEIGETSLSKSDYVMTHPGQAFSIAMNLVPFLNSNSQNRATMSGRHQEQAVALKYREQPLVQSVGAAGNSFDDFIGSMVAQTSPVDGEVTEIKKNAIIVKLPTQEKIAIPIYDNYPLNDAKGVLDSEPVVKPGDKIRKGQLISDTTFTKDGVYAPGTNLHVAYAAAKGYNVDDGVVISDSAAKKLTSVHMYKKGLSTKDGQLEGIKKYRAYYPDRISNDQAKKLDDTGVIRVGETVEPGDTLIAALAKQQLTSEDQKLRLIHKSLVKPYKDKAITWESDHPGKVVEVFKKGKNVTVHVKTEEPAVVGDKIVARHANKGIISCVDSHTYTLTDLGWKLFKDLAPQDRICTLNTKTGEIEYQKPIRIIAEPYKGKMYRIQGRRLDLCVTPNHRHYVRNAKPGTEYKFETSEEVFGHQRVHSKTGIWRGEELETIVIPGLKGKDRKPVAIKWNEEKAYSADTFLEFFGYYITEGCISNDESIHIAQSKEAHPYIYENIANCLYEMGYEPSCKDTVIVIYDPRLAVWLRQFGKSHDKYIPREFLNVSGRQLNILADAIFAGDGMRYEDTRNNHTRLELFTSSKRLADDYQELALKLGVSANIREPKEGEYVVRFSLTREAYVYNDARRPTRESWVDYDDMVYCVEVPNSIIYIRRNGTCVWSGNSILPDSEMPQTKEGKAVDVLLNPMGVPGRMNIGQLLEPAAARVAEKTGKVFKVNNFSQEDNREMVMKALEANKLPEREPLFDPATGKQLDFYNGKEYMLKLQHQVDKKMSVRNRDAYDRNLVPRAGGKHGGQSIGQLELYALLAHGAKNNIREMASYKSDKSQGGDNDELWTAIQAGEMLPPPKPTFAYNKFISYLRGLGVNVEKDGNSLNLTPLTDKAVLEMSSGEIKDGGRMVKMKTLEAEKNGLFDPTVTGGHGGKNWSHINLREPMPNPVFEGAIRSVVGIRKPDFEKIISGDAGIKRDGTVVDPGSDDAVYGPTAISLLLANVDVDKTLKTEEERIQKLRGQQLNETNKRIKYLRALKKLNMKPTEAYMMKHVPVIPPQMRPISVMDDGAIQFEDVNQIYKHIALTNKELGGMHKSAPDEEKAKLRAELYDELKALSGVGGNLNRQYSGILDIISGSTPKTGFFQDKLVKRRQDLSMRSTIVPEPALSLDEIGIPRKAAMELYKPFVVRELRTSIGYSPLQAQQAIKENREVAQKALERVADERPLLVKRDPVLHKYGIQAFKPKLIDGKAIKVHPLTCSGYNADFDGDTMSAFVPVTKEAVDEAYKMFPSNIIFSPSSGKAMYTPVHEMQVGLYSLSEVGKDSGLKFSSQKEWEHAVSQGKLSINDIGQINGQRTTLGRLKIDSVLPKEMQNGLIKTDLKTTLTKKNQENLFQEVSKRSIREFPQIMDKLKDLGNNQAYYSGFSIGLKDVEVHKKLREKIINEAKEKSKGLDVKKQADAEKYTKIWENALMKLETEVKDVAKTRNKTSLDKLEISSGIKGNGYRQLTAAPVLFTDAQGKVVLNPVTKSYSEGLSVADYWSSMSGGRKGIIQKVQTVAEPGYLSKMMMNSSMNLLIQEDDCGTKEGINLPLDETDIIGRYTQAPVKVGHRVIPAGTLLTPQLLGEMRAKKISRVMVRSPLKCIHGKGVCKKCFGLNENGQLHDKGVNIGVISAQSLGERGTQLSMKNFHCSHAKTLVTVRFPDSTQRTLAIEELFDFVDTEPEYSYSGIVSKICPEGWFIFDGSWTALKSVSRHIPDHPMVMVSDSSGVTICQNNHPIAVRKNLVSCEVCGYHRLKRPGKNASIKNGKWYCPKCNRYQYPLEERMGEIEFAQPRDLTAKRFYVERYLLPPVTNSNPPNIDPYLAGIFVAEGCICYTASSPGKEKKPYFIHIAQNNGTIKDKIVSLIPEDWNSKVQDNGIVVHSIDIGIEMEDTFGRYSKNICLPSDFLGYPDEWLFQFLAGLIDGDGTVKPDSDGADRLCIDTTSFELAQQIVMICAKLNIPATLNRTTVRKLTRNQGFRVSLRVTEYTHGKLSSHCLKAANVKKLSPDQDALISGSVLLSSINEILYTEDYVYDVETASGVFVAGGLLSHNSGGVHAPGKESLADVGLEKAQTLMNLPKTLKGSCTLASKNGTVQNITKSPAGGFDVYIDNVKHYVPARLKLTVSKGSRVKKGQSISSGPINPHELLPLVGLSGTQNFLSEEMHKIYGSEGIRRRNTEVVVKSISNVTYVDNPGDHPEFIRGDFANTSQVNALNRTVLKNKAPIVHTPVLRGVELIPLDVEEDWMARLNHEELKSTVIEGAQRGWQSKIHGPHPIPAVAHGAEFGKGTKEKPWEY